MRPQSRRLMQFDKTEKAVGILCAFAVLYLVAQIIRAIFFL